MEPPEDHSEAAIPSSRAPQSSSSSSNLPNFNAPQPAPSPETSHYQYKHQQPTSNTHKLVHSIDSADMEVIGIVIRRKSFGKWLAFATLKILFVQYPRGDDGGDGNQYSNLGDNEGNLTANENEDSTFDFDGIENITIGDETIQTLRIVFQRGSPFWDEDSRSGNDGTFTCPFPSKNALLPYGSKIRARLRRREPDKKSACQHEVCSYQMIDDPRSVAYEDAKVVQKGVSKDVCHIDIDNTHNDGHKNLVQEEGVYLHKYLKSRGDYYLKYNNYGNKKKVKKQRNNQSVPLDENNPSHGTAKAKSYRSKIFASWLVDEFGPDGPLKQVLEIAGGKGALSVELSILVSDIQCTVIDPFIRCRSAEGQFLTNKELKRIQKVNGKAPKHIAKYFRNNDESNAVVERCSILLGLHPDQPTEDIVDLALLNNKPFAVIPCCVYPCLFPMRALKSGKSVKTYEDFMQYLIEKDDRLKEVTLGFQGKNRVIYFKG